MADQHERKLDRWIALPPPKNSQRPETYALYLMQILGDQESGMLTGTPTALLVEDEAMLRHIYATQLADLGYDVQEAANGDAALEIMAGAPPFDLLMTDVRMDGAVDGIELSRRVAISGGAARIILMSGDESDEASGVASAFLLKPFTLSALASILGS